MEPQRIVKKRVEYPGNHTFKVFIRYTNAEHAKSEYERYVYMSDSMAKIEPELLCDKLDLFKAGIITSVSPLQYDVRTDTWTFNVYGFGVYNEKMTTKEIVSQYYIKKGL
nr:MAG TPA: hypothetical protein [Caudoviricetes sp.]